MSEEAKQILDSNDNNKEKISETSMEKEEDEDFIKEVQELQRFLQNAFDEHNANSKKD